MAIKYYKPNMTKIIMQGKLIAVAIYVHIETSSLWAEF